jgi:hypothetical protein
MQASQARHSAPSLIGDGNMHCEGRNEGDTNQQVDTARRRFMPRDPPRAVRSTPFPIPGLHRRRSINFELPLEIWLLFVTPVITPIK